MTHVKQQAHWTSLYYEIVSDYFWAPQMIGRISDPKRRSRRWEFWDKKLKSQELALNHILNLAFYLAPQELVDNSLSSLVGKEVSGMQLVKLQKSNVHLIQPDLVFTDSERVCFIEMKVDSRSGVDQFAKYAIAAKQLLDGPGGVEEVILVMLVRHAEHSRIWKRAKLDGLTSLAGLRDHTLHGFAGGTDVWKEKAVPRFISGFPGDLPRVREVVETMEVRLADYGSLAEVFRSYPAPDPTAEKLIKGVLVEIERRGLVR